MLLQYLLQILHHLARPVACQVHETLHLHIQSLHRMASWLYCPASASDVPESTHSASRHSRATT